MTRGNYNMQWRFLEDRVGLLWGGRQESSAETLESAKTVHRRAYSTGAGSVFDVSERWLDVGC